mgnify:FL=1
MPIRRKFLLLLPLLAFLLCLPGEAKDILDIADPALTTFSDRNGLPSNSVMTITRDRRGYLWVGTQDGAAYYNGHRWTTVNMPERNISNYIYDVLAASDGSIWFATDGGGIHQLKDGVWQTFTSAHGLPGNSARVLLESPGPGGSLSIWAGMRDGLARFDGARWTAVELGESPGLKRVRSLLASRDDDGQAVIWVGTYGGRGKIQGGEINNFDTGSGLPHNTVFSLYEQALEDGGRRILAGTDAGIAFVRSDEAVPMEDTIPELKGGIRSITEAVGPDGERLLWIGTDGKGAVVRRGGQWTVFDRSRGLATDTVFSIVDARTGDGSVWMATLGSGISRLEFSNWATIKESHGIPNHIVFGISELEGTLWFATFGNGLAGYRNGAWSVVDERSGLPSAFVYSLYRPHETSSSAPLFAGTENGVVRFEGGRWVRPQAEGSMLNAETWGFLVTRDAEGSETHWIATSRGLAEIRNGRTTVYNSSNGLPDDRIRDVVATGSGSAIWAATYGGGVARLQNGKWDVIDLSRGLPSNRVLALAVHTIGGTEKVLAGTGGGIAIITPDDPFAPPQVLSPETVPEMLNGYVLDLVSDARGRIYALTNKGVTRFTGLDIPGTAPLAYTFTIEDGLPSNECVAGAGYFDGRRIFAGTVAGVAILDTLLEPESSPSGQVQMDSLIVAGSPRGITDSIALTNRDNNIVFEYSLLTDFREHSTLYRTQLEGLEETPTSWIREPHREFAYLPPGEYTFRVWARDHAGNVFGSTPLAVKMFPAWWQTWWAVLLYFLAIVAVVSLIAYAVYKNRLNRILAIERVRARIAADLHDDIGANLSQISIMSEVMKQKLGKAAEIETKPLAAIADTSRELMASMSDIVWAINPDRDNLNDLIQRMRRFATDVFSAKDIEFSFNAPANDRRIKIDLETRRELHLMFKEAVNNCVRHSGCSKVEINVAVDPQLIDIEVRDNGTGFDLGGNSFGNGLASMRSRSEAVGGKMDVTSSAEGTAVRFSVPNRSPSGIFERIVSFR